MINPSAAARADMGRRATEALEFLDEAFAAVNAEYMARLAEIAAKEPWETRKIANLAVAAKITQEVRGMIVATAGDGKVAEQSIQRLRKIEAMSPERRKLLGLVIPGVK